MDSRSPRSTIRRCVFDLVVDPSEKYNVAAKHADVIAAAQKLVAEHRESMKPAESQLEL